MQTEPEVTYLDSPRLPTGIGVSLLRLFSIPPQLQPSLQVQTPKEKRSASKQFFFSTSIRLNCGDMIR